jgi:hypothetical protein
MPIDPSIIGNVMAPQAPQLPDVNAMMQTRTRGMENVYNIETGRQQAAKEEAAAQAAAQEDALVKALLPAYTYGIETGDMAGALDLVPPEMRESVLPYVQALQDKPPEQVRSALIGSLSTSKAGQEALAAIQRAAAVGVQQGQLGVSQQRLAFDQSQVGVPKPMSTYEAERIKLDREKATREAAKVSPDAAKQQQAVNDMKLAVSELTAAAAPSGLIDLSTGSIAGDWLDSLVAQGSGGLMNLPGDVAAAQMEVVAHLARMAVPRFEGPQSEKDAALYERASGQLADPTTSTTIKKAAAQTLIDLIGKRKDQFVSSGVSTEAAGGGADSGVLEYDENGDMIE